MTRRYTPGTGSSGGPRLTPSPTPQGPRVGVQVVRARAPREGLSAAEEIDGAVPPIDLAEGLTTQVSDGNGQQWAAHDSTLSNCKPAATHDSVLSCLFCGAGGEVDLLIQGYPAPTADTTVVCARCVERLVDALRAELPRRRLRLAMERLAAGTVSIEMVEAVERLAAQGAKPIPDLKDYE